jgi:hypothetical protein
MSVFRNGDSGAVHSRAAVQARQSRAKLDDANKSTQGSKVTVADLKAQKR